MSFDYEKSGNLTPASIDKDCHLVYICHPLGGDFAKNVQRVTNVCRVIGEWCAEYAALVGKLVAEGPPWADRTAKWDIVPITPYLACIRYLDDTDVAHRKLGLGWDLKIIETCQELWVIGKHVSYGMQREITHATQKNKIIRWLDYEDFGLMADGLAVAYPDE